MKHANKLEAFPRTIRTLLNFVAIPLKFTVLFYTFTKMLELDEGNGKESYYTCVFQDYRNL